MRKSSISSFVTSKSYSSFMSCFVYDMAWPSHKVQVLIFNKSLTGFNRIALVLSNGKPTQLLQESWSLVITPSIL